ncbi:SNF2 family N-terminal domain-containing protein [Globomyces pollinis-pini]|nr:SNF2 family N-terminal domain-containing protein [Globomyces pollinis-pini]
MRISDSDLSELDELSDESDHQKPSRSKKKMNYDEEVDELESDLDSIDELPSKVSNVKKAKGKLINFDSFNIPKGDKSTIEKFVTTRTNDDGVDEVLVKYKNMSYNSADWIPISTLQADKATRQRIQRFLEKPQWETQWSEDEPYNPSYIKVDRILDEGELDGVLHYLTKWCALPYDNSTWEEHTVVEKLDAEKIDEFHRFRQIPPEKVTSYSAGGRSSPLKKWKQLKVSPLFKDDNTLRSYQLEGLNWLMYCWYNKQSSILADEMGLGKTVQSTAFLYELLRTENVRGPFLVVVPLSTMGNWEREMKGWTDMNVIVYHGNQNCRNLIVETEFYYRDSAGVMIPELYKFDVLLTTYEMAMSGAAQLRPIRWRCAVLDEAHRLKNKTSKITEALKLYSMEHRVLLTGTPLQNSLDELWALLNFLDPENFGSEQEFQTNYGSMTSAVDVERLQLLLKPLMLRRLKEDVEKSIPIKEETVVEVELTTTQKKWYRSILERNFSWLKQSSKKNVPNLINTMIELRKCCIHPWLLKGAEEQILTELNAEHSAEKQLDAMIKSSGKMVLLDKLLKKLKVNGHKVLIFSQMTKCLDIIQDYLRAKNWGFERIDGGVRGELRQASIDRFSQKDNTDSFVFLLCTRAGGVGINLTAADTCIIFDSDWNPQNDLQAQSRCHRIGQKKMVKIYRLITRNTYEREMFDRASMKLGLDKALLQKSEGSILDSDPFSKAPKSSSQTALYKQEVEDLLKKGAYGAFMDDGAGDKFCEEDIDQILERRTMVIRHDENSEARKGSMFSKASFQAVGSSAAVDVNDPDFWDKVAEQANLEVVDELPEESLIIDMPRVRKQVTRLDGKLDTDSDNGSSGNDFSRRSYRPPVSDVKSWTTTERNKLERLTMQHGFNKWDKMALEFGKRTEDDLKACCRALVLKCLETCQTVEKDVVLDVKRALALHYPTVPPVDDSPEARRDFETRIDTEEQEILEIPDEELPWIGHDDREKYEYLSFLVEAPLEYLESLEKKAKNLLIRIALMYNIRNRHHPTTDMFMPKILGAPPSPWWGAQQDRELIVGICKHGYQQYQKIWADKAFGFVTIFENESAKRLTNGVSKEGPIQVKPEPNVNTSPQNGTKKPNESDGKPEELTPKKEEEKIVENGKETSEVAHQPAILPDQVKSEVEGTPVINTEEADDAEAKAEADAAEKEAANDEDDIETENEDFEENENVNVDEGAKTDEEIEVDDTPKEPTQQEIIQALEAAGFHTPTPTELGVRVRRILNSLTKHRITLVREKEKEEILNEKNRAKEFRRVEKQRSRENDFSKKHKHDFQRTVLSYGVKRIPNSNLCDWAAFKSLAELPKKTDEAMEIYLKKLIQLSKDTIAFHEKERKIAAEEENAEAPIATTVHAEYPGNEDGETITYDRAKKILKRIDYFDRLRQTVLHVNDLALRLLAIRRHGKGAFPKWWEFEYDLPFLIGVDRYGLTRGDLFVEDASLPFKAVHEEYLKSLVVRKEKSLLATDLVFDKFEEKFWMKDSAGLKRFEMLVSAGEKPPKVPKKTKTKADMILRSDPTSDDLTATPHKIVKSKLKEEIEYLSTNDSAGVSKTGTVHQMDSSGDDTDQMLEAASKRLKKKKRVKKGHDYMPTASLQMDEMSVVKELERMKANHYPNYAPERLPPLQHYDSAPPILPSIVREHDRSDEKPILPSLSAERLHSPLNGVQLPPISTSHSENDRRNSGHTHHDPHHYQPLVSPHHLPHHPHHLPPVHHTYTHDHHAYAVNHDSHVYGYEDYSHGYTGDSRSYPHPEGHHYEHPSHHYPPPSESHYPSETYGAVDYNHHYQQDDPAAAGYPSYGVPPLKPEEQTMKRTLSDDNDTGLKRRKPDRTP